MKKHLKKKNLFRVEGPFLSEKPFPKCCKNKLESIETGCAGSQTWGELILKIKHSHQDINFCSIKNVSVVSIMLPSICTSVQHGRWPLGETRRYQQAETNNWKRRGAKLGHVKLTTKPYKTNLRRKSKVSFLQKGAPILKKQFPLKKHVF